MRVDRERIQRYLVEILSNVRDIEDLFDQHEDEEILQRSHFLISEIPLYTVTGLLMIRCF